MLPQGCSPPHVRILVAKRSLAQGSLRSGHAKARFFQVAVQGASAASAVGVAGGARRDTSRRSRRSPPGPAARRIDRTGAGHDRRAPGVQALSASWLPPSGDAFRRSRASHRHHHASSPTPAATAARPSADTKSKMLRMSPKQFHGVSPDDAVGTVSPVRRSIATWRRHHFLRRIPAVNSAGVRSRTAPFIGTGIWPGVGPSCVSPDPPDGPNSKRQRTLRLTPGPRSLGFDRHP
jgi:hypothetical protein